MIAKDKLLHIYMGVAACVVLTVIHHVSFGLGLLIGCAALGVFYEVQQWYRKEGQPDIMDAIATTSPGIVAYFVFDVIPKG